MRLEDQVCSIELAKELKEVGIDQRNSLYLWQEYNTNGIGCDFEYHKRVIMRSSPDYDTFWERMGGCKFDVPVLNKSASVSPFICELTAAFTTDELMYMLPNKLRYTDNYLDIRKECKHIDEYICFVSGENLRLQISSGRKLADCVASSLLFCINKRRFDVDTQGNPMKIQDKYNNLEGLEV